VTTSDAHVWRSIVVVVVGFVVVVVVVVKRCDCRLSELNLHFRSFSPSEKNKSFSVNNSMIKGASLLTMPYPAATILPTSSRVNPLALIASLSILKTNDQHQHSTTEKQTIYIPNTLLSEPKRVGAPTKRADAQQRIDGAAARKPSRRDEATAGGRRRQRERRALVAIAYLLPLCV
jgi:hypothetical protein